MGGGPAKDHLLITSYSPTPQRILDSIQAQFPQLEITDYPVSRSGSAAFKPPKNNAESPPITHHAAPEEDPKLVHLWRQATILITLASLPPNKTYVPNLTLLHLLSAGIDRLTSHPLFTSSAIPITTSSGIHGPPISEYLLLSLLSQSKHYDLLRHNQLHHRAWLPPPQSLPLHDQVHSRIGILGYGSIGRSCAAACKGIGMDIVAFTATPRPDSASRRFSGYNLPGAQGDPEGVLPSAWYSGKGKEALHTFLAQDLDVLLISVPLTPATRSLLSAPEFHILAQKRAFIVNISRGPIIDQPALIAALKKGQLKGAALDVTDPEPLPEGSELWGMENVFVTPHVSARGQEYGERAVGVCVENLRRRGRGEGLVNEVKRGRGY
ncbi:MAG: hypothetical protein Q9227_004256 [Pyrenula ochraceoflavens]